MRTKLYIIIAFLFAFSFSEAQDTLQLSMQEAVEYAKEHNFDNLISKLDVDIAKKKVKETIGIGLPQVNGNGSYNNYLKLPVQPFGDQLFTLGNKNTASGALSLNQLVFDGSYLVGIQATKAYQKISELSVLKTNEALIETVLQIYASIIISQETLEVFENNLTVLEKNLHDTREIYNVGLGEEQSVDQMQYNLNVMKNSILNVENNIEVLYANMKYILQSGDKHLVLTTDFDQILADNIGLESEDYSNIDNHIDMKIAENRLITDKYQLKYEKSKYWPSLGGFVSTQYNFFNDDPKFFTEPWYNTSVWGLNLNVPIFSGFQRKSRVSQAKFQVSKSEFNKAKTYEKLQRDIRTGFLNFQNALAQYDLSKQQLELSEKILNKEQIKFNEGIGSSIELTVIENQVYQAQASMVNALSNLVTTKIAYDKALGKFNLN